MRNIYPLVHASHFYDGITKARPNLRPYVDSLCVGFSAKGNCSMVWDIPTTFEELQKQVAAGLNFTATGIPYWTTDIGGYSGGDPLKGLSRIVYTLVPIWNILSDFSCSWTSLSGRYRKLLE